MVCRLWSRMVDCGRGVVRAMTTRARGLARVPGYVVIVVMSLYVIEINIYIYRDVARRDPRRSGAN